MSTCTSLLPPVTSRRVVREGLSKNIATLADLYALEIDAFETGRKKQDDPESDDTQHKQYRKTFLEALVRLRSIMGKMLYCRLEPNLL